MKVCSKCKIEKQGEEFSKQKTGKLGLRADCKACVRKRNNSEKYKTSKKLYRLNRSQHFKDWYKAWYAKNKEEAIEKSKIYYKENKHILLAKYKTYYKDNVEIFKYKSKRYRTKNKDRIKAVNTEYVRKRRSKDVVFKITNNIRNSILRGIKANNITKVNRTETILGCSFSEFKIYIESKFEPWMSWDKYGLYNGEINFGWDLDHIVPISSAKSEEDVYRLNHYSNFQPLCSFTNRHIKINNHI